MATNHINVIGDSYTKFGLKHTSKSTACLPHTIRFFKKHILTPKENSEISNASFIGGTLIHMIVQESLTKKFLGTLQPQIMQNLDEVRTQGSIAGADFQAYDPSSMSGSLLDNQFQGLQVGLQVPTPQQPSQPVAPPTNMGMAAPSPSPNPMVPPTAPMGGGGGGGVEVHFVFGEWCGHSRNAKPEFQNLVSRSDVKTSNGMPVKFVMTEDTSPGMEKFKSSVQGFPSYMMVKPNGQMEELVGHNRTADSIVSIVQGKSV